MTHAHRNFGDCLYVGETDVWGRLQAVHGSAELRPVEDEMARTNRHLPEGWPIGYEQDWIKRREPKLTLVFEKPDHSRVRMIEYRDSNGVGHLLTRKPSELAAYRLWAMLDAGELTVNSIRVIGTLLGCSGTVRQQPARTTRFATGESIEFMCPERIPSRLRQLIERLHFRESGMSPLLHAIGIYFETLIIHPFDDGNGRLARLLFLAALQQTMGLRAPIYPLGPALAANREAALKAYHRWEFDDAPLPLVNFVAASVRAHSRALLSVKPPMESSMTCSGERTLAR